MATVTQSALLPDAPLARVIARIESSDNLRAVRFEPLVYAETAARSVLARIANVHGCDAATARVIYSASFGLFQIMGFNLYAPDSKVSRVNVFDYCGSTTLQLGAFLQFLDSNDINFTLSEMLADNEKLRLFARIYNGDAPAYSAAILDMARKMGFV